jgi:hypothetical protein
VTSVIRKLGRRVGDSEGYDFMFRCPGCRCEHSFRLTGLSPRHTYNGDPVEPTIEPELTYEWGTGRCRSTIAAGMITFSDDTTHRLAGKTLRLEPIS